MQCQTIETILCHRGSHQVFQMPEGGKQAFTVDIADKCHLEDLNDFLDIGELFGGCMQRKLHDCCRF